MGTSTGLNVTQQRQFMTYVHLLLPKPIKDMGGIPRPVAVWVKIRSSVLTPLSKMVIVWVLFSLRHSSLGIPVLQDAFQRRDIRVLEELVTLQPNPPASG